MELEFGVISDFKATKLCAPAKDLLGADEEEGPQALGGWCVCGYGNGWVNKDRQFQNHFRTNPKCSLPCSFHWPFPNFLRLYFPFSLPLSPASSGFPEDKLGQNAIHVKKRIHCLLSKPFSFPLSCVLQSRTFIPPGTPAWKLGLGPTFSTSLFPHCVMIEFGLAPTPNYRNSSSCLFPMTVRLLHSFSPSSLHLMISWQKIKNATYLKIGMKQCKLLWVCLSIAFWLLETLIFYIFKKWNKIGNEGR